MPAEGAVPVRVPGRRVLSMESLVVGAVVLCQGTGVWLIKEWDFRSGQAGHRGLTPKWQVAKLWGEENADLVVDSCPVKQKINDADAGCCNRLRPSFA